MTNILIIGDIVCTESGHDMVIGFTNNDRIILQSGGISDQEYFDVIGNYDDVEGVITWH